MISKRHPRILWVPFGYPVSIHPNLKHPSVFITIGGSDVNVDLIRYYGSLQIDDILSLIVAADGPGPNGCAILQSSNGVVLNKFFRHTDGLFVKEGFGDGDAAFLGQIRVKRQADLGNGSRLQLYG